MCYSYYEFGAFLKRKGVDMHVYILYCTTTDRYSQRKASNYDSIQGGFFTFLSKYSFNS